MREILNDLERWQRDREDIALATVVGVRGSSPRQPGSHLGMTRAGKMAGSVSAGCVENDVYRRALDVLDRGDPVVASFDVSDGSEIGVGLSCGGAIDVLIERFAEAETWNAMREAVAEGRPAVLAVALEPAALLGRRLAVIGDSRGEVSSVVGSLDTRCDKGREVERASGSSMDARIVEPMSAPSRDARIVEPMNAPGLDARVIEQARALLRDGGTSVVRVPLCEGEAAVFLEAVLPATRLILVGATDTAAALTRLAKVLGFEVVVIDAREAYAQRERVPEADELICAWPSDVLAAGEIDERTSIVTLAHDPKLDVPALACALLSKACYIGALGSRRTHEGRKQALREMGYGDDELARIHSPVGLDLGGKRPEEIALAIIAEIVAVRHGRTSASPVQRREDGAAR